MEDDSSSYVTLKKKGALGVCNASKEENDDLVVTVGNKVHRSCRDPYINKKNIKLYNRKKLSTFADGIANRHSLRADHGIKIGYQRT